MIVRLILIVIATLLGLVVINWLWQFLKASQAGGRGAVPQTGEPMVQDPQCRTYLPKSAAVRAEIDGQEHYFCGRSCAERYREASAVSQREER
jgi:YHS domain-containing protein